MAENKYKYLGQISSPEDVKKLSSDEMEDLCRELRERIVEVVMKNGGHLASNLGAVELTAAIHKVFDCPRDHVIFDVGHQSYAHKLLTGRNAEFDTLRKSGGISGFTNREESEYDCFGAGHSSTSLSAALGFANADRLSGSDAYTVVVLGDGAFTGGMIHEALNNCDKGLKLIIILNENEMSISKNIGRFAMSIAKLRRKSGYFKTKRFTVNFIKKIPLIGNWLFRSIRNLKKSIKNSLYGSNYFEDMGLYYLGPADGNNYLDVESLLRIAKEAGESVVVHLKTKKGKGYELAEEYPDEYHGVLPSDSKKSTTSFSLEMGRELCRLAQIDSDICAITAAMSSGTGLDEFSEKYKDRFFDVGIAEEHATTFAAGLAANGKKAVFAVYSTFLQRAYDQMIHDVALQGLPVVFCIDRAGFNNRDGATHNGIFDVAFMSQIPNLKIYAPISYEGLRLSLREALESGSPAAVRYPSGEENKTIVDAFYKNTLPDQVGVRTDLGDGENADILIVTHGRIAKDCLAAKNRASMSVGVVLCEYLAPYSKLADEVYKIVKSVNARAILFVEEEIKAGGFCMNLSEKMREESMLGGIEYNIIAAADPFVKRAVGESYSSAAGIGEDMIYKAIESFKNNFELKRENEL